MATAKASAALDKKEITSLLVKFFQKFQQSCNHQGPVNASEFEPFLAKNFQLQSNDRVITRSLADYMNRIAKFQKKFSHVEVTGPAADPIISGNKIAVQYNIDLTYRNGQKGEVFIIGVGTIEDNRIASWTQVTHEKGSTPQWDA